MNFEIEQLLRKHCHGILPHLNSTEDRRLHLMAKGYTIAAIAKMEHVKQQAIFKMRDRVMIRYFVTCTEELFSILYATETFSSKDLFIDLQNLEDKPEKKRKE